MSLSVDDLRLRVTSTLGDDALQGMLDAAYEAIDNFLGTEGVVQELLTASGNGPLLMLSRRALSIGAVVEGDTTLAASDYELRASGQMLYRLNSGSNPRRSWRSARIDVTYTPYVDAAERDRVATALVNLDINYKPGLVSETIGDWQEQFARNDLFNYQTERSAILATLGTAVMLL
jgi:hypothetical protein